MVGFDPPIWGLERCKIFPSYGESKILPIRYVREGFDRWSRNRRCNRLSSGLILGLDHSIGIYSSMNLRQFAFCAFAVILLTGCSSSKGRVEAPELNADAMADSAMDLCDSDGDGFISSSEIKASPALKFAKEDIDTDGDGKLSRDELLERFNIYVDTSVGLQGITLNVRKGSVNGDGLMGATVRLVPEPFMADYIEEAEGKVIDPSNGLVEIMTLPPDPGVRVGMYTVKIESDDFKIASKYNEKSTLGIEVPPITSAATSKPLVFVIK